MALKLIEQRASSIHGKFDALITNTKQRLPFACFDQTAGRRAESLHQNFRLAIYLRRQGLLPQGELVPAAYHHRARHAQRP